MFLCLLYSMVMKADRKIKGGKEAQSRHDSLDLNLHSHGNTIALLLFITIQQKTGYRKD